MYPTLLAIVSVAALTLTGGAAVEIHGDFPARIDADERYVIYSHGLIVEGDNSRPVHPERGLYDFPAIKAALFKDGGFNLIADHRPKNTEIEPYVTKLESWVRRLLAAGVRPGRITLVGFSRGAQLTAYASARLASTGVNTAVMGACSHGDIESDTPLTLGGHVLSIYETTDALGSCATLARRSRLASFEEVAITTGKGHAAFFLPRPEWVDPLKAWITKTNR